MTYVILLVSFDVNNNTYIDQQGYLNVLYQRVFQYRVVKVFIDDRIYKNSFANH